LNPGSLTASQRDGWELLLAQAGREGLFVTPEWIAAWTAWLGEEWTTALFAVRRDEKLSGIAPLGISLRGASGTRTVSWLGLGCSDYQGVLSAPEDAESVVSACMDALVANWGDWQLIDLPNVPAESPTVRAMILAAERLGMTAAVLPGHACPELQVVGSWAGYQRRRGSSFRSWLGRKYRWLAAEGEVRVVQVTGPEQVEAALRSGFRLHQKRWASLYTSSLLSSTAPGRAFHRQVSADYARRGWTDLSFLALNDSPIAFALSFSREGRFSYYVPAHDPAYDAFSPGTLLLARLVERAHQDGLHTFDFMIGEESYKYRWATHQRRTVRILAGRPGRRGATALHLARARHLARSRLRTLTLARRFRERFGGMLTS
jgi:CelD/BcsL family acetyltransferase involved in cellulose biosynthesis